MENAVIYARYSSHSQTEQSIEGQLAAGRAYAASKGYNVVREYCDRAKTGTNDNREEFQRMLKHCSRGFFSVIIVWKVDRFGRNREELTFNKYKAKKHGVRVEYVAENISSGPEGVIVEALLEGMAEYYSLQLSQNIQRGQYESAKKFRSVNGSVPLGYKLNKDKQYEIVEPEATIVREMFGLYNKGMTMAEVTAELNRRGYKSKKGQEFGKNSIYRILTNELYRGVYKYKDLVYQEDAVPAIIPKDIFNQVQDMLKEHKRMPYKNWSRSEYVLSGKLFCECGSTMMGKSGYSSKGKKYTYYVCSDHYRGGKCKYKPIRSDVMDEKIIGVVNSALNNEQTIDQITEIVYEYYLENDEADARVALYRKGIEEAKAAIANLLKSIESGLDYSLVKHRLEDLKDEVARYEASIAEEESIRPLRLNKDYIKLFLTQFLNGDLTDSKVQKKIVDTFINRVQIGENIIEIALNYSTDKTPVTLKTGTDSLEDEEVRTCLREWAQVNGIRNIRVVDNTVVFTLRRW